MKASFIRRYGSNQVVEFGERPMPQPGQGQLLVQVHAAGVNPVDFKIRDGKLKLIMPGALPLVLGNEFSGVVAQTGPGVSRFKVGDAVFARMDIQKIGAFAEHAVVDEADAAFKPANLSHVQAAAVPLAALTAWQALFEKADLKGGHTVLIHAGSGGVGTFAIQLAKSVGAVVATTVGARNAELVRSLGADIVIDYASQRFEDCVRDCDVILDTQGGAIQQRSFSVLKRGGTLVSINGMPDRAFAQRFKLNPLLGWIFHLANSKPRRLAQAAGGRYEYLLMHPSGEQLTQIARLLESGAVKPVIDRVFPLVQTAEALAYSESGRASGKVVIEVRGDAAA